MNDVGSSYSSLSAYLLGKLKIVDQLEFLLDLKPCTIKELEEITT